MLQKYMYFGQNTDSHTDTYTQTRNTCVNTYLSTQGNHRHISKHKLWTHVHQQAQTHTHTEYIQQTYKHKITSVQT